MRHIILLMLILIPAMAFSQEGAIRSMKTISDKIIFRDLSGNGNKIIGIDNLGKSKNISVDGSTVYLINDTLRANVKTYLKQTLSGTNVTWNLANGQDATITLSGNTVITISNAIAGMTGTIWVTNASSTYTITFAGYVNSIDPYIRLSSNIVITSGAGKSDDYTYKYNGEKLSWNGTLDRQ